MYAPSLMKDNQYVGPLLQHMHEHGRMATIVRAEHDSEAANDAKACYMQIRTSSDDTQSRCNWFETAL